jgi:predicted nucleotidyltransferase
LWACTDGLFLAILDCAGPVKRIEFVPQYCECLRSFAAEKYSFLRKVIPASGRARTVLVFLAVHGSFETMNTPPGVINTIAERFGSNPQVEKGILFGSSARGDERERSDIDIAVIGPEITDREWLVMWFYADEDAPSLLFIDLLRYKSAPKYLRVSIDKDGVAIYERH